MKREFDRFLNAKKIAKKIVDGVAFLPCVFEKAHLIQLALTVKYGEGITINGEAVIFVL